MALENAVTIDKELRTKSLALELFNAILDKRAPTQVAVMSEGDFLKLYGHCFTVMAGLEMPARKSLTPGADDVD